MARYNTISINGVYLTKTGLVGGVACKTEVSGLVNLRPELSRIISESIDGTPKVQFRSHKGKPIGITVQVSQKTAFESLLTAIDAAEASDDLHALLIDGDTGNFDLDCVLENIEAPGTFSNGLINEVKMTFRVHTVNSITA